MGQADTGIFGLQQELYFARVDPIQNEHGNQHQAGIKKVDIDLVLQ